MRSCLLLSLAATIASAQTPPLAFEVASIRSTGSIGTNPGRGPGKPRTFGAKVDGHIVELYNTKLVELIARAYEVKDYQITGPGWLDTTRSAERFDVHATIPEGATEKDVPQMLRTLLADRFKLEVHRETKDHPVLALVVSKPGKLKEADPAAPPNNESMKVSTADGILHIESVGMSMPELAELASRFADRPVVDRTELQGRYQMTLDLSLDELKGIASDATGASIFASLQPLGLKLEAKKAPFPQIVIDHLEKTPTEN